MQRRVCISFIIKISHSPSGWKQESNSGPKIPLPRLKWVAKHGRKPARPHQHAPLKMSLFPVFIDVWGGGLLDETVSLAKPGSILFAISCMLLPWRCCHVMLGGESTREVGVFFVCFLFIMNMLLIKQQIPQMDSSADFLFVFLFIELFIGSMSQSGRRETVFSANFFPLRGHQVTILPASTPCNLPALFKHTLLCKHTHLHTLLLPHRNAHA